MEDRRLRFSLDKPALIYRYSVCVKKTLWWCSRTEMKEDVLDLTDAAVRKQLIDMGFTATSERRWQ